MKVLKVSRFQVMAGCVARKSDQGSARLNPSADKPRLIAIVDTPSASLKCASVSEQQHTGVLVMDLPLTQACSAAREHAASVCPDL